MPAGEASAGHGGEAVLPSQSGASDAEHDDDTCSVGDGAPAAPAVPAVPAAKKMSILTMLQGK